MGIREHYNILITTPMESICWKLVYGELYFLMRLVEKQYARIHAPSDIGTYIYTCINDGE